MLRKLAILATGAVGVFLLIAGISWMLGLGLDETRRPIAVDPSHLPDKFVKPDATATHLPRPGEGAGGWIQRTDPKTGRLVEEFRYDKLEPLAEGEFLVTHPQSRFHLADNRVIDVRSNTGTVVAPQNIPQQGTLKDNVTVRIYETRKGLKLDMSDDSPDIVATIHLRDATFNAQLGKLDSTDDVLLTGRNAEFRGTGLTLVYNEPQQRIDYMEITQGQYLKYTPPPEVTPPEVTPPEDKTGGADSSAPKSAEKPAETAPAAADAKVQYYQVHFERSVHVRSGGRSIDADDMLGYFAFNRRSNIARLQTRRTEMEKGSDPFWVSTDPAAAALAIPNPSPLAPRPSSEEVIMTWSGKMVVTPVTERPAQLRTDQDLLLNFRGLGQPVTMRSDAGDVITCANAQYHEYHKQVAAIGSAQFPLLIESPALGEVTADALTLRLDEQAGQLAGAGHIKSKAEKENQKGLPPGFAIRWADHVDLLLTRSKEKPSGLKTARFAGKVEVSDPRFTMRGEQLAVHFEPDRAGRNRRFSAIDASGDVVAQSDEGRIAAQTLHLDADESPDGRIRPTVLVASGDVRVSDKTQTVSAGALSATFTDKSSVNKGKPRIDVAQIVAADHVKLTMPDGTRVSADQLEADNATGLATLTGRPVVIDQQGATLSVAKLKLNRAKERVTADGEGRFDYEQQEKTRGEDAAAETANRKPQTANPSSRTLHVTWTDGMSFDQIGNLLTVNGHVVADQSDRPEENNQLTAATVVMELTDRDLAKQQGVELKGRSMLKSMAAGGDVVLLSSRWLDATRHQLESRLRLAGPRISFDNDREIAKVHGAGTLLLEDYRDRAAAGPESPQPDGAVHLTGRGATLFTWNRWMTMDASRTEVVMDGNVEMTHQPAGKTSGSVQMQTHRLTADMKGIGGIEALAASKNKKIDIDHILAEGGVQIRDDKRLISAHRLHYDGAAQTAVIEAQPGRRVNIVQLDEPKPILARRILWNLKLDRLEIDQPGY
ncbi:MAG: hypothetical protein WC058_11970 [Phycisphaeraceae bacterium]